MSNPINSPINLQVRATILTADQLDWNLIRPGIFSSFAQINVFDLAAIHFNTPKVATPQNETYGVHDEHEQKTGATVTYDPSDPGSLFSTAEQLAKCASTQDKIKAQELFMQFQEQMLLRIQLASILHDLTMFTIKTMRGIGAGSATLNSYVPGSVNKSL